jgi:outer membrane protein TolC
VKAATSFVLVSAGILTGCATAEIDSNYEAVARFSQEHAGSVPRWLRSDPDRVEVEAEVARLLAQPLRKDDAVRIALNNSPAFQVVLAEAAAASADTTRSARVPNPVFSFERLLRSGGGERELELGRALSFSLLDVLLLPARLDRAELKQQEIRLRASASVLALLIDVRRAWVEAVSALQVANYHDEVANATAATAELARRMQGAGNYSRLQQAREQAQYADAVSVQIRARQDAVRTRENLIQLIGLSPYHALALRLPERLPDLPGEPMDEATVARATIDERLDVRIARAALETAAKDLGLTEVTSVASGIEVAGVRNSETGTRPQRGFEIELLLPIFDFGDARRAGDQARYLAAVNRTVQVVRNASSQVRSNYDSYRNAYDLARHYRDEVIPLRRSIADEAVLQYNGMFISIFELLAETRNQTLGVIQAIQAERDFWLADAALSATLLGYPIALTVVRSGPAVPVAQH